LKKRPAQIVVDNGHWTMTLSDVERVSHSGRYQNGQEFSLLAVLQGSPVVYEVPNSSLAGQSTREDGEHVANSAGAPAADW
jgi:hypothetical protein